MNKLLKRSFAVAAVLSLLCTGVYASELQYDVQYNHSQNTVRISGTTQADGESVALQILNKGKNFEDVDQSPTDSSLILYRGQHTTAGNTFDFTVEYDAALTAGEYAARLMNGSGISPIDFDLRLASSTDYTVAVTELKTLADAQDLSGIKALVDTHSIALGFDVTIYDKLSDKNSALKPYMEYVKTNGASSDDCIGNAAAFQTYMLMAGLNEKKIDNMNGYLKTTAVNKELSDDYFALATTESKQKYIAQKMQGGNLTTISQMEDKLKEALLLGEVRYASGNGGIRNIFSKYGSVIGVSGTAAEKVYTALSGNDYLNGSALASAYKKLVDSTGTSGGGGSGGGGSGGSSSGSGSKTNIGNGTYFDNETINQPQKFANFFRDIEGITWASEAIIALADKGIVNGVSEGYFNPNDAVTREQFAKLLVTASNLSTEAYSGNHFSDVSEDDWFCRYVNVAYDNRLLNGVGDGRFGTGEMISRQDMMVMLYNAFRMKNIEMPTAELTFSDSASIAEYAAPAVAALYELGIINGVSETEFDPLGTATRAQAAKIIYEFINRLS